MADAVFDHGEKVHPAPRGAAGRRTEKRCTRRRLALVVARRTGIHEPSVAGGGGIELNRRTVGASEQPARKIDDLDTKPSAQVAHVPGSSRAGPARDQRIDDRQNVGVAERTKTIRWLRGRQQGVFVSEVRVSLLLVGWSTRIVTIGGLRRQRIGRRNLPGIHVVSDRRRGGKRGRLRLGAYDRRHLNRG